MPKTRKENRKAGAAENAGCGTLYVVATPIGNLEDITLRALRILAEADYIAAEDTRHTRKLLTHFSISTPTLSYYKEREQERAAVIIKKLRDGSDVALVSDAGTPAISDPGAILVKKAAEENISIVPIPGPSSLAAALSVSGLTDNSFVFLGFAPSRKKQRQDLLTDLSNESKHLVFFEAPHRVPAFLQDCLDTLGNRLVVWCRELTKIHEEVKRGTLDAILSQSREQKTKGESVFVISGAQEDPSVSEKEVEQLLKAIRNSGEKSLKDAVREITDEYKLSRSKIYSTALRIWQGQP